jgi:hypothetical protein
MNEVKHSGEIEQNENNAFAFEVLKLPFFSYNQKIELT